jgi:predicted ribosomally synthesized peptide with nif11-like leader
MNENLKKFLDVLNKDKAIQEKFAVAKSQEEAFKIASAIQSGYTFEEFKEAMTAVQKSIKGELSDKDLDAVAGGAWGSKMPTYSWSDVGSNLIGIFGFFK